MTLRFGLCGCGGMGRRHIGGMAKLKGVGRMPFELVAVCDVITENAQRAADLAEERLGRRPETYSRVEDLPALDGLIITTSPETHAEVALSIMDKGAHVMVEKPVTLTVAQGKQLVEGARRAGRKVAVAENYRRDPINRLAKALIDASAIGRPYLYIQTASSNGERVIITPWRHQRDKGGIIIDMGIHYADLLEYFLGPAEVVMGMNALVDSERIDGQGQRIPVDAEDLSIGIVRYQHGALAHWMLNEAGRGERVFQRMVHGTGGTLNIPRDRSGKQVQLIQRQPRPNSVGEDVSIPDEALLDLVPDFALDDVTAALFGGERMTCYTMDYPDIDASLLGVEQHDFADAIEHGREPEVTGEFGLRSLALVLGFLESDLMGRAVTLDEMLADEDMRYQGQINV